MMSLEPLKRWRHLVAATIFFVAASAACAQTNRGEVEVGLNKVADSLWYVAVAIAFAGAAIGAGIFLGQLLRRRE